MDGHLALGVEFFAAIARGEDVPLHDLRQNATATVTAVAAEHETDLRILASRIRRGDQSLVTAGRLAAGTVEVFRGVFVSRPGLLALELGELLVHGRDLARACGDTWVIDADDARVALTSTTTLLPYLIDPTAAGDLRLTIDVRVAGGHRSTIRVDRGVAVEVPPGSLAPDAILSGDPVAMLLLSFGRVSIVRAVATGRVVPRGRRPWMIARLLRAVVAA